MAEIPPIIFDRANYRARRDRAAKAGEENFLSDIAISAIAERIAAVNRSFETALNLNSHYSASSNFTDLAGNWVQAGPTSLPGKPRRLVIADEEALPFADQSFDLIVSALSLHAVNDLPGALRQICGALKPDGLFMAALFAGDTLKELKQSFASSETELRGGVSPRVSPFADIRDLGGLMQRAGFALPVADIERTTVRYRHITKLFEDLRAMGETNVLAERTPVPLTRNLLASVVSAYTDLFAEKDGRLPASFEIAYLTGWAPHESQQKPLRPGSAQVRLADALGTKEHPAGEKPG